MTKWGLLERDQVIQVNSSLLRQEASETNISDISQGDTFGLFVMLLGAVHKLCQRPKGVRGGWGGLQNADNGWLRGERQMLTLTGKGGRGGKANADIG